MIFGEPERSEVYKCVFARCVSSTEGRIQFEYAPAFNLAQPESEALIGLGHSQEGQV